MIYETPTGPCSGRGKPGTLNLYNWILTHSGRFVLAGNGVYNCRPPRGATHGFSAHAEGRALDINAALPNGFPNGAPVPPNSVADQTLRGWVDTLVRNHEALGIQRVLYKSINWRCDHGYTKSSVALAAEHANHMHAENTREASLSLTSAYIATVLGAAAPDPPPTTPPEDEVRRAVMVPGGKPMANGRWPFWMLTETGDDIISCNGAPALVDSHLQLGVPVTTIPKPHRPIVGIEPAPDGNGLIACADDQGTYTIRVK